MLNIIRSLLSLHYEQNGVFHRKDTLVHLFDLRISQEDMVNTLAGDFLRAADTVQHYTYGTGSAHYLCRDVRNHSNTSLHPLLLFLLPYQIAFYQLDIRYTGMIYFIRVLSRDTFATFRFAFKMLHFTAWTKFTFHCSVVLHERPFFAFCTF